MPTSFRVRLHEFTEIRAPATVYRAIFNGFRGYFARSNPFSR